MLVFNKRVYLGMSILDISKALMYDFHYNYMKKKYDKNCRVLMTDTDGLMYEIKSDFVVDISADVSENVIHQTLRKALPLAYSD